MRCTRAAVARLSLFLLLLFFIVSLTPFAQAQPQPGPGAADSDYRSFFGLDPRNVVWVVAELHLMFAAFVLGVPIFAVIVEFIGMRTGDVRYDHLAREFTKLLSAAFTTTASLGGLLVFVLFGLYPTLMRFLTQVFHTSMYIYGLLFFAEAFTLYLYFYGWDAMKAGRGKWTHFALGILLNVWGTIIMGIANSWTTYMMSPSGIDPQTMQLTGSTWDAVANHLWMPLNIHRFLANIMFGGFVAGAYAAIKLLSSTTDEERAHYDWMGYIGNFIGVAALIPLPFAGYYLGREVYSFSPVMGNNMMGGAFSWTFIMQAMLIGMLFIGANFYLWSGMRRIQGAERYLKYIKYLNIILIVCFAVWLTPHNLPLSSEEQMLMGGQYHPVLKYLGLMPAKNAVINFIILSTFFSFLIYRRGNKGRTLPFSDQGKVAKIVILTVLLLCLFFLGAWAWNLYQLSPRELDLQPDRAPYFEFVSYLIVAEMLVAVFAVFLTFRNRGILGQGIYFASTAFLVTFVLGVYGFVILEKANPFLRHIAVSQVLMVLSALLLNAAIDIFQFRKAEIIGQILWGKISMRSQYALILLALTAVMTMGLMGFVRSGLREDWHVYGVMRDTSPSAFTPTQGDMSWMVGGISIVFLALVTFVFWLGGLGEKKTPPAGFRDEFATAPRPAIEHNPKL
ncbi:MAG: cytochrome ubiquinol oxidase subunit I [Acidobacteria bacterium]|nr:cytochrome ubiquinol oxidase subunit I [Acidobacteriota bacterium]